MLSRETQFSDKTEEIGTDRNLAELGLKKVFFYRFKLEDLLKKPENREIAGRFLIAVGVGLIRQTNPMGATLVDIGVRAYFTGGISPQTLE